MGISALLFAISEYKVITKREKNISKKMYIFKLIATTGVMLTFLVTALYLAPIVVKDFWRLFKNSNLFYHLVIPILSFIAFVFFEHTDIERKYTLWGIIPIFIYAIFYVGNILLHLENGKVLPNYDWYFFAQGSLMTTIVVFILMHIITYVICLIIWFINKKVEFK